MKNKIRAIFGKVKTVTPDKKVDWYFDEQDSRRFFFMHIPKTAGTTFRKILDRHSPNDYLWPDQEFLRNNNNRYPNQKELLSSHKNRLNSKFLIGHYNINLLKHLSNDTIVLTFIRNPYERTLSHIKHLCALNEDFKGDPNLVVEKNLKLILYTQSKMLRYQPRNKVGLKKLNANIKRINFIGLTEEFEKSIALCNKMFDWKLELIEPQNQREDTLLEALSPSNKMKIIEHLIPEIRTFKRAHLKFTKLCEEYGI